MQIIQSYILVLHLGCDEEEENNNISDNKGLAKILLYKPELMKWLQWRSGGGGVGSQFVSGTPRQSIFKYVRPCDASVPGLSKSLWTITHTRQISYVQFLAQANPEFPGKQSTGHMASKYMHSWMMKHGRTFWMEFFVNILKISFTRQILTGQLKPRWYANDCFKGALTLGWSKQFVLLEKIDCDSSDRKPDVHTSARTTPLVTQLI